MGPRRNLLACKENRIYSDKRKTSEGERERGEDGGLWRRREQKDLTEGGNAWRQKLKHFEKKKKQKTKPTVLRDGKQTKYGHRLEEMK